MLKLSCSPAKHYKTLKSGVIRHQKTKASNPLWRLVLSTDDDLMFGRFFATKPEADSLWACIDQVVAQLPEEQEPSVLFAQSLVQSYPEVVEGFAARGFSTFAPTSGGGPLAAMARRWDKWLDLVQWNMVFIYETDLTVEELARASGTATGILGPASKANQYEQSREIAEQVCRNRGRDPKEGRRRQETAGRGAPLNTSTAEAPPQDGLDTLLRETDPHRLRPGWVLSDQGELLRSVAEALERYRAAATPAERQQAIDELARMLQGPLLVEPSSRLHENPDFDCERDWSSLHLEVAVAAGPAGAGIQTLDTALAQAVSLPIAADGRFLRFFAVPVQWRFTNGEEARHRVSFVPWHGELEAALQGALAGDSRVCIDPAIVQQPGLEKRLRKFCDLLRRARFGPVWHDRHHTVGTAIPAKPGSETGTGILLGVIRGPVADDSLFTTGVGGNPLEPAEREINGRISRSRKDIALSFFTPVALEQGPDTVNDRQKAAGG